MDNVAVRVIVVAYASGETLQSCIDALRVQTFERFEAVIVDNGPVGDRAVSSLQGLDERFRVIEPGKNLGFAAGNNLAAVGAACRWLALLNPDAIPERDWLRNLVTASEKADAKMAGSLQLWRGHEGKLDGAGDAYHISGIAWRGLRGKSLRAAPETGETFSPCAAAALYDRRLFELVGGFDEAFFAYHEDVDLAFRMRMRGGRTLQVQEAVVSHVGSGRPGEASEFAVRLGTRNRIWTYLKNMPGWFLWAGLPLHACAVLISLARDVRRHRGSAAFSGISDAFGSLPEIFARRRVVQRARCARIVDVVRAMTVSPLPLMAGAADVREWRAIARDCD